MSGMCGTGWRRIGCDKEWLGRAGMGLGIGEVGRGYCGVGYGQKRGGDGVGYGMGGWSGRGRRGAEQV